MKAYSATIDTLPLLWGIPQQERAWVYKANEVDAQIATLNAKLARIRKIVFALDSAEKHSPSKVRCLLDEILREVGYE